VKLEPGNAANVAVVTPAPPERNVPPVNVTVWEADDPFVIEIVLPSSEPTVGAMMVIESTPGVVTK
jgi:hypothetical protein